MWPPSIPGNNFRCVCFSSSWCASSSDAPAWLHCGVHHRGVHRHGVHRHGAHRHGVHRHGVHRRGRHHYNRSQLLVGTG